MKFRISWQIEYLKCQKGQWSNLIMVGWLKMLHWYSRDLVKTFTNIVDQKWAHVYLSEDGVILAHEETHEKTVEPFSTSEMKARPSYIVQSHRITAAPPHSIENSHRFGMHLKCRSKPVSKNFWAPSTHGDEAQHSRIRMSHIAWP